MPDRFLRRADRDVGLRAVPRFQNYLGCRFYVSGRLCCCVVDVDNIVPRELLGIYFRICWDDVCFRCC